MPLPDFLILRSSDGRNLSIDPNNPTKVGDRDADQKGGWEKFEPIRRDHGFLLRAKDANVILSWSADGGFQTRALDAVGGDEIFSIFVFDPDARIVVIRGDDYGNRFGAWRVLYGEQVPA